MRARWKSTVAAAAALACGSQAWPAQSDAESFGARRWPSAPRLELDANPSLCGRMLQSARDAFVETQGRATLTSIASDVYPPVVMETVDDASGGTDPFLQKAELDLDGDGRRQVVIHRVNPFNWKGDWHYAYVFPSPEVFAAVRDAAIAKWSKLGDDQYPSPQQLDLGSQQYFPGALTIDGAQVSTGDVWASTALFSFEGKYFFAFAYNDYEQTVARKTTIFRLRASGRVDPQCVINWSNRDHVDQQFASLSGMPTFLGLIRAIGEPGPDSGTLHAEAWHQAQAEDAVNRAVSRPWTVAANVRTGYQQGEYFVFGARMINFLDDWSQLELWNRREYQTLVAAMPPAIESYAGFLQSEFGMSEPAAKQGAKRVVENLLARRILIPSHYRESADSPVFFSQSDLHEAVMRRDREAFETAISRMPEPASARVEYTRDLSDAVEWSYGLERLLALGADPNAVNRFGKNALMVAAHLNRIDSVRKLLRAGARVDLLTTAGEAFSPPLTRFRRTALMYAAENAGAEVIDALLDAGADKSAVDSQGNGLDFYLARNPRFTAEQRQRGIEGIAASAPAVSSASFDCGRARTGVELAICTNPALRVFDRELSVAYERLRSKGESRLVREQRDWLKVRNTTCGADPDTDCLAETMRTRVRYLHMRLAE